MKNTNKLQKVLMTACLAVLVFFAGTIALRLFTRQVLIVGMGMDNAFTRAVFFDNVDMQQIPGTEKTNPLEERYDYDWASIYPFEKDNEIEETAELKPQSNGMVDRYLSVISTLKERIDNYTQSNVIGYSNLTAAGKTYDNMIGWNFASFNEYNGVYQLSDGHWTSLKEKRDMSEHIASFIDFNNFCEEQGIDFLYVQAPYKISKYADLDISGNVDFSNQNADDLLNGLSEEGVDTFDLRQAIYDQGLNHHDLFYKTDHHWKAETALWAAGEIASYLNANYGYCINTQNLNPENYYSLEYENLFLGSLGKKVTLAQAEPDDFSLLYPQFHTNIHMTIPSIGIDSTGDFSITYNMLEFSDEPDYYNKNQYGAYGFGNRAILRIENLMETEERKKVLMIHDSFGSSVIPFFAMGLKSTDSIDLRYFNGSLETYIKETQPDIVIVMYNAGEIINDVELDNQNNLFNFR